jgi:hypothetical protein
LAEWERAEAIEQVEHVVVDDAMAERAARRLYEQGLGYDIDADETARQSMLAVARSVLRTALTDT